MKHLVGYSTSCISLFQHRSNFAYMYIHLVLYHMQGGKVKIPFPIYYEVERPPTAGVPEGVIEKEQVREDG